MKMTMYEDLTVSFCEYHKNSVNIALHLLTTPLAIISIFLLVPNLFVSSSSTITDGITDGNTSSYVEFLTYFNVVYAISLVFTIHLKTWIITCAQLYLMFYLTTTYLLPLQLSTLKCVILFCVGYFGQDFAHYISGEPTFQSSYSKNNRFWYLLVEHTYFLLPLTVEALIRTDDSLVSWFVQHDAILDTKLNTPSDEDNMENIMNFVLDSNPTHDHTTHWWYHDLKNKVKESFDELVNAPQIVKMFQRYYSSSIYDVEVLEGMNEIYVASPKFKINSDKVFFMEHVDGPYVWWPFCQVYRVLIAINENKQIMTQFPIARQIWRITKGDVLGFDFNRELHLIKNHPTDKNTDFRIVLKAHYVVYPKTIRMLGQLLGALTTRYDIIARNLFLYTLVPESIMQRLATLYVLITTKIVALTCHFIGFNNLVFLVTICGASYYFESYSVLLYSTSFIHYGIYIGTFWYRNRVNYGGFVRDAVLYKTAGLLHLYYHYLQRVNVTGVIDMVKMDDYNGNNVDTTSVGMVTIGLLVAFAATYAIGWERTYFGEELGHCDHIRIKSFPYNLGHHPMICGGILTLLGMHKLEAFREAFPYLIPIHVFLYGFHLFQEVFDFHANLPLESKRGMLAEGEGYLDKYGVFIPMPGGRDAGGRKREKKKKVKSIGRGKKRAKSLTKKKSKK
jgi:hypothetical protein